MAPHDDLRGRLDIGYPVAVDDLPAAGEVDHFRAACAQRLPDREQHRIAQPARRRAARFRRPRYRSRCPPGASAAPARIRFSYATDSTHDMKFSRMRCVSGSLSAVTRRPRQRTALQQARPRAALQTRKRFKVLSLRDYRFLMKYSQVNCHFSGPSNWGGRARP